MATTEKIQFANASGEMLAAALVRPERVPRGYALFAHCFTCGKDNAAAARISRLLAARGFAVLRFDFTGLGGSEGDFGNTGFSSNVDDLLAAADYLRTNHQAPTLLIGHSFGGTAVLAAAPRIAECKAVVTIAAPADPAHVAALLGPARAEIESQGEAVATIAGRSFPLRRKFLDDLERQPLTAELGKLRRALLVFHAPLDNVVSIDEAGRLFGAARHPKSFVSLDGADHLLSRLADAQYVADTTAAWVERYLPPADDAARPRVTGGEVLVAEVNRRFLRDVNTDDHGWLADEPKGSGGDNLGPDPYEHLLAALGTCTSMTLRLYANRKSWPLDDVDVRVTHNREHVTDCEGCDTSPLRIEVLRRFVTLHGALSPEQRERLLEIANRCPVHRTLEGDLRIETLEAATYTDATSTDATSADAT